MPIIVFEGIDGSGKETQIKKLLSSFDAGVMRYPDIKGPYGKILSSILEGKIKTTPLAQFLAFAADISKDSKRINSLAKSKTVVLDRYIYSTIAYQSAAGVDFALAKKLSLSMNLPRPDVIILLDLPPKLALERKTRQKKGRLQCFEKLKFLSRVRKNYLSLAKENFHAKWKIIDASRSREEVSRDILKPLPKL